jgi:hypothetical protein
MYMYTHNKMFNLLRVFVTSVPVHAQPCIRIINTLSWSIVDTRKTGLRQPDSYICVFHYFYCLACIGGSCGLELAPGRRVAQEGGIFNSLANGINSSPFRTGILRSLDSSSRLGWARVVIELLYIPRNFIREVNSGKGEKSTWKCHPSKIRSLKIFKI